MLLQTVRIHNQTRLTCLGDKIEVADRSLTRMRGLLGRNGLESGQGMLIVPSQAIHTIGMSFAIDVLFLDKHNRVVGVREAVKPYRAAGIYWRAEAVLELPVGTIAATQTAIGDSLTISDPQKPSA